MIVSDVSVLGAGMAAPQFLKASDNVRWNRLPSSLARFVLHQTTTVLSEKSLSFPKFASEMGKNRTWSTSYCPRWRYGAH